MGTPTRHRADEAATVVVFACGIVLQAGSRSRERGAAISRYLQVGLLIYQIEHVGVYRIRSNAGILTLAVHSRHLAPGLAVIRGAIHVAAVIRTVENHLAVGRHGKGSLGSHQGRFQFFPGGRIVVATVHDHRGNPRPGGVIRHLARPHKSLCQRRVSQAVGCADGGRVARSALVDVGIGGAVIVADGRYQRASRNAHDIKRHGLFDAPALEFPQGDFRGDVIRLENAVSAGDPSFLVVEGVNFHRTRPMDGVARNPRRPVCVYVDTVIVALAVSPSGTAIF